MLRLRTELATLGAPRCLVPPRLKHNRVMGTRNINYNDRANPERGEGTTVYACARVLFKHSRLSLEQARARKPNAAAAPRPEGGRGT